VQRSRKSRRPKAVGSRVRRSTGRRSIGEDLKKTITVMFIWFVVIVNVVLTASLIFRLVNKQKLPPARVDVEARVIEVEVQNGCGVPGLAKDVATYLRDRGFDVVDFKNWENWDEPRTLVVDRTSEDAQNANKVAAALGLGEEGVIAQQSPSRGVDVTVILGKDYRQLSLYR
jgi:hypothetical protein